MMAGPGLPEGVVIRDHVRIIDVLPTILDLNMIAASATFEGVSLLPMLNGEDLILPVYMEGMLYGPSERALIAGNNKVMYDTQSDTYKLYDLAKDRREKRDIAGDDAERTAVMQAALTQWHEVVRASSAGNVADSAEQERALEALKSLGYINK